MWKRFADENVSDHQERLRFHAAEAKRVGIKGAEMKKIAVLDIGGTAIKSGVFCAGRLSGVRETSSEARLGGEHVMRKAEGLLSGMQEEGFDAIGICTAGQVEPGTGRIRYANDNIPGYTGMCVKERLEKKFRKPAAVANDVNAAALGEGRFGAGRGYSDYLCVAYGTGVGGAAVINGNIYSGSAGSAGEFGAMVIHGQEIEKGDPFAGCYERYASVSALINRARVLAPELDSGRKIFARLMEPEVKMLTDCWIDEIVLGLRSLIHIFNPPCVILGGGVMEQPYLFGQIAERTVRSIMTSFRNVKIVPAELKNTAGLLGAAALAEREIAENAR